MKKTRKPSPYKGRTKAQSHIPDSGANKELEIFYEAIKPLMYDSERIDFALQTTKQLKEVSNRPLIIIKELAEQSKDWDFSHPVVDENGEILREPLGSWENFYKEEIEPIAGPYAEFVETYRKVIDGEISHEEGQEEISERAKRIQSHKELRDQGLNLRAIQEQTGYSLGTISNDCSGNQEISCKNEQPTQSERATEHGFSDRTQRKIDKIRKLNPDLAAQCEAGTVKVAEAERQVGLAPTDYEKAKKLIYKLDSEQDLIKLQHEVKCRLNELNNEEV